MHSARTVVRTSSAAAVDSSPVLGGVVATKYRHPPGGGRVLWLPRQISSGIRPSGTCTAPALHRTATATPLETTQPPSLVSGPAPSVVAPRPRPEGAPVAQHGLCECARQRSPHHMHAGTPPPHRDGRAYRRGHLGDRGATASSTWWSEYTLLVRLGSALLPGVPSMPHTLHHAMRATQHARTRSSLSIGMCSRDGHPPPIQVSSCAAHLGVRSALRARRRSLGRAACIARDPRGGLQSS